MVHLAGTKPVGAPILFNITSKGQSRSTVLRVQDFSLGDFLLIFIVPFIGGMIFYTLGFVVYLLKPNTRTSWVFFFSSLIIGFYTISGFEIQSTYYFANLHYFIIPFMPASLFHIGSIFPEKKQILIRHPWLEYLIYLPAMCLAVGYQLYLFTFSMETPPAWIPHISQVTNVNRTFTLMCIAGLAFLIIHSLFKASTIIARQRASLILLGITIAFLPSAADHDGRQFLQGQFPLEFSGVFHHFLSRPPSPIQSSSITFSTPTP